MARRAVAALCALGALWVTTGMAKDEGGTASRPVLVAARDLAAGDRLAASDVRVLSWPASAPLPGRPLQDPHDVTGRLLAGAVSAGEPVTRTRLAGEGLLTGQSPTTVAVHVPLADPGSTALVHPGATVDLVTVGGHVVVAAAVVVAVDPVAGEDGGAWGAASTGLPAGITVAGTPEAARRLAGHLAAGVEAAPVTLVLRSTG